jgi:hypothetical protein
LQASEARTVAFAAIQPIAGKFPGSAAQTTAADANFANQAARCAGVAAATSVPALVKRVAAIGPIPSVSADCGRIPTAAFQVRARSKKETGKLSGGTGTTAASGCVGCAPVAALPGRAGVAILTITRQGKSYASIAAICAFHRGCSINAAWPLDQVADATRLAALPTGRIRIAAIRTRGLTIVT